MHRHRGHNEGSIFERKDKSGKVIGYRAQLTLPDGSRKSISGKTKKEVRQQLDSARAELAQGRIVMLQSMTVSAYLEKWLKDVVKQSVRPRTYDSYDLNVRRLVPLIGHHKLDALKPGHVQACYGKLLESGLSPRSVEQAHTVLHTALHEAVRMELAPRNPCQAVRPPRPGRREMRTLTPEQVRQLFAHTVDDRLHALWVLMTTTGMRVGEAIGLKWEDVDFDAGSIIIRRSLQRQRGNGLVFVPPKTERSRRTVYPDPKTMLTLRQHAVRQKKERLAVGPHWQDEGLIFTTTTGGRLDSGNVRESLGRRLKNAGLPPIRVHDLRHTAATYLFSQGKHPSEVQALLGHSTITLTLDTYTHVLPQQTRDTTACMGALFSDEQIAL